MEIFPTIEALLHYANIHLLFDELDNVYARNRILELLHLSEYEEYEINDEEIEAMTAPTELLEALATYALAQRVINEDQKEQFKNRLMDCLLKRPGEIDALFSALAPAKAFDWLNEYGVKSGYIKPAAKKWDGKSTKGKIEAVFTGCNCGCGCGCGVDKKYPACRLCRDNEGYGRNINMRSIPLELYGERMFFYYCPRPIVAGHGTIVSEYHRPLSINSVAINKMFDFIDLMPGYVIAAKEGEHESYTVSSRPLPFNKAPDLNKFKSQEYPYINITTINWYFGGVRLEFTNREKLLEYAEKLIEKWRADSGNEVGVTLRKIESNYCLELLLINKNKGVSAEFSNISKATSITSLMGVFCINQKLEDQLKQIERFVTKEEKFTPSKLEGDIAIHADMINRLLLNAGNSKPTALEASLDVKDEVNKTLESALSSLNVPIDVLYGNF